MVVRVWNVPFDDERGGDVIVAPGRVTREVRAEDVDARGADWRSKRKERRRRRTH